MLAYNRPGKGGANMAYTESDLPEAASGAKCDVYDCLIRV